MKLKNWFILLAIILIILGVIWMAFSSDFFWNILRSVLKSPTGSIDENIENSPIIATDIPLIAKDNSLKSEKPELDLQKNLQETLKPEDLRNLEENEENSSLEEPLIIEERPPALDLSIEDLYGKCFLFKNLEEIFGCLEKNTSLTAGDVLRTRNNSRVHFSFMQGTAQGDLWSESSLGLEEIIKDKETQIPQKVNFNLKNGALSLSVINNQSLSITFDKGQISNINGEIFIFSQNNYFRVISLGGSAVFKAKDDSNQEIFLEAWEKNRTYPKQIEFINNQYRASFAQEPLVFYPKNQDKISFRAGKTALIPFYGLNPVFAQESSADLNNLLLISSEEDFSELSYQEKIPAGKFVLQVSLTAGDYFWKISNSNDVFNDSSQDNFEAPVVNAKSGSTNLLSVIQDTQSAYLEIKAPVENEKISELPFDLNGQSEAYSRVTIRLLGLSEICLWSDNEGFFKYTIIELNKGENILSFEVEDSAKNVNRLLRTVYFSPN